MKEESDFDWRTHTWKHKHVHIVRLDDLPGRWWSEIKQHQSLFSWRTMSFEMTSSALTNRTPTLRQTNEARKQEGSTLWRGIYCSSVTVMVQRIPQLLWNERLWKHRWMTIHIRLCLWRHEWAITVNVMLAWSEAAACSPSWQETLFMYQTRRLIQILQFDWFWIDLIFLGHCHLSHQEDPEFESDCCFSVRNL